MARMVERQKEWQMAELQITTEWRNGGKATYQIYLIYLQYTPTPTLTPTPKMTPLKSFIYRTNPICFYVTLQDVHEGRRRKHDNKDCGIQYFRSVSRYDINNAFLEKHLPLSDHVHGLYKVMPPKLLQTSGSGLIMYMFVLLRHQLGVGKDCDYIDQEQVVVSNII